MLEWWGDTNRCLWQGKCKIQLVATFSLCCSTVNCALLPCLVGTLLPFVSVTQKGCLGALATPVGLDASVMACQCHGSSVLLPTTSILGQWVSVHWGIGGDGVLWGPCERNLMCAKLSPLNLGALVNGDLVLPTCHSPSHFSPLFPFS